MCSLWERSCSRLRGLRSHRAPGQTGLFTLTPASPCPPASKHQCVIAAGRPPRLQLAGRTRGPVRGGSSLSVCRFLLSLPEPAHPLCHLAGHLAGPGVPAPLQIFLLLGENARVPFPCLLSLLLSPPPPSLPLYLPHPWFRVCAVISGTALLLPPAFTLGRSQRSHPHPEVSTGQVVETQAEVTALVIIRRSSLGAVVFVAPDSGVLWFLCSSFCNSIRLLSVCERLSTSPVSQSTLCCRPVWCACLCMCMYKICNMCIIYNIRVSSVI